MISNTPLAAMGGLRERLVLEFVDESDSFKLPQLRNYNPQYAQVYHTRLLIMRQRVQEAAYTKWGASVSIAKASDISKGTPVCLIGALYKEMEFKPSILREISEDVDVPVQPILPRYTSQGDTLILEDESQRIILIGNVDIQHWVTGVTIAVLGKVDDRGRFDVSDFCFAGMPLQPSSIERFPVADCYLGFLSGFCLGPTLESAFSCDMCIEMLTGQFGTDEHSELISKVGALIYAGNLIESDQIERKQTALKARYLTRHVTASSVERMRTADDELVQLTASMDVYVMPGSNDPGNYLIPQQPLHPAMLLKSHRSSGLHLVSNPFRAVFAGVRVLGTSGQNVTDIYKNSTLDNPLDILESNLRWAHIAPTAPDTLGCYPYTDCDPFILEKDSLPDIYFAGNQPVASNRVVKGDNNQKVLLLSIPEFCKVPTLTLVNLRTLQVETVNFQHTLKGNRSHENSKFAHVNGS